MNKIDQFEELAERAVEGTFFRLFGDRLSPTRVAAHLERAIEEHQLCSDGGALQAPTHYWVHLHPGDYQALVDNPQREGETPVEDALAHQISALVSKADMALDGRPIVHIRPDEAVAPQAIRVDARREPGEEGPMAQTRQMEAAKELADGTGLSEGPKGRPFLILEGQRHIPLTEPRVSIGRALSNDVIIDDPRVSRHHAQLRHRYGHYILVDLGSSGGTRINDYPVEECVLHSGDVISFAGVEVVYGEDPPTPIPLPAEDDTPLLKRSDIDG